MFIGTKACIIKSAFFIEEGVAEYESARAERIAEEREFAIELMIMQHEIYLEEEMFQRIRIFRTYVWCIDTGTNPEQISFDTPPYTIADLSLDEMKEVVSRLIDWIERPGDFPEGYMADAHNNAMMLH